MCTYSGQCFSQANIAKFIKQQTWCRLSIASPCGAQKKYDPHRGAKWATSRRVAQRAAWREDKHQYHLGLRKGANTQTHN